MQFIACGSEVLFMCASFSPRRAKTGCPLGVQREEKERSAEGRMPTA
jgi:hypothetical protein